MRQDLREHSYKSTTLEVAEGGSDRQDMRLAANALMLSWWIVSGSGILHCNDR